MSNLQTSGEGGLCSTKLVIPCLVADAAIANPSAPLPPSPHDRDPVVGRDDVRGKENADWVGHSNTVEIDLPPEVGRLARADGELSASGSQRRGHARNGGTKTAHPDDKQLCEPLPL